MKQYLITTHMLVSVHDDADDADVRESVEARLEDEAGYLANGDPLSPIPGSLNVSLLQV